MKRSYKIGDSVKTPIGEGLISYVEYWSWRGARVNTAYSESAIPEDQYLYRYIVCVDEKSYCFKDEELSNVG